jgi:hypothetical protein
MARTLIIVGLLIAAIGVLWPWLGMLSPGRLPGDIAIRRGSFTLYVPIVTCLILSIALSLILWFANR